MKLVQQVLRFLVSGGSATAVHWSVMTVLVLGGQSPDVATAGGAFCGAVANYFLQYHFTFRSGREHRQALPVFALVSLASLVLNSLFFHTLNGLAAVPVAASQFLTTGIVAVINFLCFRRFVFHDKTH